MNRSKRKKGGRFWEPPGEVATALTTIKSGPIYQNWLIGKEAYAELVQSLEAPLKWLKETQKRIAANSSATKDSKSEGIITPPTSQTSLQSPAKPEHEEPSADFPKEVIVVATPDASGTSADGRERVDEEEEAEAPPTLAFLVCETSSDEEEKRDGAGKDEPERSGTPLVERLRRPPIRSATSPGKVGLGGGRGRRRSLQTTPSLLNSNSVTPTHTRQVMNHSLSAMERIFGSQRVRHLATMNEEKKKLEPFSLVKTGDRVKDAMARKEACLNERRDKIRRERDEKTAAVKARAKALEQSRQLELQRRIGGHKQTGPDNRARRLQIAANRELAERKRREAKAKNAAQEKAIKTRKDPKPPAKLPSPRTPGPLADVSSSDEDDEDKDDDGVPLDSPSPLRPHLHRRPPTPPKSQLPNSNTNSHLLYL